MISQVRGEFEDMGIDEAVLQELQRVKIYILQRRNKIERNRK